MDMNNVNRTNAYAAYNNYQPQDVAAKENKDATAEAVKDVKESGVVYEKSSTDRSAIIEQLKADAEQRTAQLRSLVENMMKQQGEHIGTADSMWRFLASGNFTVTAEAKAQAEAAIAEDGYYGVEKTSQRIVDFAKALTGGDASKAEEMREAFIKGFKEATKTWGKELPEISQKTYDAVMDKFDEWVGKKEEEAEAETGITTEV